MSSSLRVMMRMKPESRRSRSKPNYFNGCNLDEITNEDPDPR